MTRSLQRQLEEEVSVEKNFGFDPKELDPTEMMKPRDDDTYSPLHDEEDEVDADVDTRNDTQADTDKEPAAGEDTRP